MHKRCTGNITFGAESNIWPHEMETAKALALAGYDIVFVDRPGKQGERVADILMDGDTWEMKSPRSDSLKAIERNVKRARNQSPCVVLDSRRMRKSPGRRNRERAEKVREDHQGDKAPPARRPTRKRHNHSSNLWYDCASKRPNGTQFTFLGRFFAASLGLVKRYLHPSIFPLKLPPVS